MVFRGVPAQVPAAVVETAQAGHGQVSDQGPGLGFWVLVLGFGVGGLGFGVSGFGVWGFGVWGFGFRVFAE